MRNRMCGSCGSANAATARECKNCGETFRPLRTGGDEGGADTRCAWEDFGQRCAAGGVFSDSTLGGGPWYCRRHEAIRNGRPDPGKVVYRSRDLSAYGPPPGTPVEQRKDYARGVVLSMVGRKTEDVT